MTTTPVRSALISVFDKAGVDELARGLHERGVAIVSTGSTAQVIADAGVPVTEVSEVTGFPECLDGRVKTLHPRVHAGILADRTQPEHLRQLEELDVDPIDLVIVNLYPFAREQTIEMIDIGGPTMVRAAAKNASGVGVVVDPADYAIVLDEIEVHGGLTGDTRLRLARKAFLHTAAYDAAIAAWFQREEEFPEQFGPVYTRMQTLRYGENPHQAAAYYADGSGAGLPSAVQLGGKDLSYNNILDTDAAWALVNEFDGPSVAIIKHTNPAGVATADALVDAYDRALEGDPTSAFGGIVAANGEIDRATAERITELFTEVVVAPAFDGGALEVLRSKQNLRILEVAAPGSPTHTVRSVSGGLLVQDADADAEPFDEWKVVAGEPDDELLTDLRFAWVVCKHVKSNAIVLAKDGQLVGAGAGQMSRVDAVRLAIEKSQGRASGAVLASDAFFPFRDGPDAAAEAGITAIVQPGGSVRDDEVVASAEEHGITMVLTGRRHFRH